MATSCHAAVRDLRGGADYVFALAGNPNVGKSTIFNALTGTGVVTANYPGKTVEINVAAAHAGGMTIGLLDLPGTYALGSVSEDQWVARQGILDGRPDAVIVVLDATNLDRNLFLLLQLIDTGLTVVAALNLVDEARKSGVEVDVASLSAGLGVPVVPTVATRREGLEQVLLAAVEAVRTSRESGASGSDGTCRAPRYDKEIEEAVTELSALLGPGTVEGDGAISARGLALLLLEDDNQSMGRMRGRTDGALLEERVRRAVERIALAHGESAPLRIIRERHRLAAALAAQARKSGERRAPLSQRLWRLTTAPWTGIPILLLTLAATFGLLFVVGDLLARGFGSLWGASVGPAIRAIIHAIAGDGVVSKILVWGPDAGIAASLEVGIPYVLTFYFLFAFLEDSGYLSSVAFLSDSVMRRLGLHGRSIIPLIAGAGCNVPAIIGTRVLTTMRERVIASTLIVLVPCSARTAVVLGALAGFAGWQWAAAVFLIVGLLVLAVGLAMNRIMPGQSSGLVMEVFPFRMPSLRSISVKTWHRFKGFVLFATPIVLGGSLVLGALYETGLIWKLTGPLAPLTEGLLGLPAVAGLTLIFAVLRKELALQLLVTLAVVQYGPGANNLLHFMAPGQLFVYALVSTIYIPCVATVAALGKELGWRRATAIMAFTIVLALAVGGGARFALGVLRIG